MAEQQHFEGFDEAPDEESRSAHKREAQALRKLVDKIADLGDQGSCDASGSNRCLYHRQKA